MTNNLIIIHRSGPSEGVLAKDALVLRGKISKYSLKGTEVFDSADAKETPKSAKTVFLAIAHITDIESIVSLSKIAEKKSTKMLLVDSTSESIKRLLYLNSQSRKSLSSALRRFDYVLIRIDPVFSKQIESELGKIKGPKFIYLGYIDREKPKTNRYVDTCGFIRAAKFVNQAFVQKSLSSPVRRPYRAMVEICRACNLRCPSCPIGSGKAQYYPSMSLVRYNTIIDSISETVCDLSLFNYGEPLLHPRLAEIIRYARKKRISSVKIHSNGLMLSPKVSKILVDEQLTKIRISVDGATKETYSKYRVGGNFDVLIKNIKGLISEKKRQNSRLPEIETQFIIMNHNEHEVEAFNKLMKNLGVDKIRYKTFNAYMSGYDDKDKNMRFIPKNKAFRRYSDDDARLTKKEYLLDICGWPWERIVINADGKIVPCCYDYNGEHCLGKLTEKSKGDWWNTKLRQNFQELSENNPDLIKICKHCPKGVPDLSIDQLKVLK